MPAYFAERQTDSASWPDVVGNDFEKYIDLDRCSLIRVPQVTHSSLNMQPVQSAVTELPYAEGDIVGLFVPCRGGIHMK
jgi:hypothetical protein